jgi:hypothetical protein
MWDSFLSNSVGLTLMTAPLIVGVVAGVAEKFSLTSQAFGHGQPIPTLYANTGVAGGKNISPPLLWSHPVSNARSLALLCVDRHPMANNWVHWIVIDIAPQVSEIPEGASHTGKMPQGSREWQNTFGTIGWGGPQPPRSSGKHQYEFSLYALNVETLNLSAGTNLSTFNKALEGKILSVAKMTGTFER